MSKDTNVNVTLLPVEDLFRRAKFPCPLCGLALDVRISRRNKPYCHCDGCGVQIFFRGKPGIERLKDIVETDMLLCGKDSGASRAITLYNRLMRLKTQKEDLNAKQGILSTDPDLENAIAVVEKEVARIQAELEALKPDTKRKRKK